MYKQIYFFQTEKDFDEFVCLIHGASAELFSQWGEKYESLEFGNSLRFIRVILKGHKPIFDKGETRSWISDSNNFVCFTSPHQKNNIVLTGDISLINGGAYKEFRKEYAELYKELSSYIKKNYKKSKDKLFYAGPDFYAEWEKGNLKACGSLTVPTGPNAHLSMVQF